MAAKKKATEEVKAALPLEELAVTEEKPSAPSRTRKAVKKAAEERPEWEERPVALKEQAPEKQQKQASEDEHKAVLEKKESEAPAAKAPRKRSGKKTAQEKKAEENDDKKIKYVLWLQRKGSAVLYRLLSFAGFVIFALCTIALIIATIGWQWTPFMTAFSNSIVILTIGLLLAIVFIVSMMLWSSSEQVKDIKDKQMLMSLSSGLIGFLALIAAIVAIFVK